ncbi:MAG: hypothetical protein ACLQNG_11980 [Acidimicrobiales bacterium]
MLTALRMLTDVPGLGGWLPVHARHVEPVVPAALGGTAKHNPGVKRRSETKGFDEQTKALALCMADNLLVSKARNAPVVGASVLGPTMTIKQPPKGRKG